MNSIVETKKLLTVIASIEPGCLGPNGSEVIDEFCCFAHTIFQTLGSNEILWEFAARTDKNYPEISYAIGNKHLSPQQASKYLQVLSHKIDSFEEQLNERIAFMIEQFHSKPH